MSFPARGFITGVEEVVLVCSFVLFSNTYSAKFAPRYEEAAKGGGS